MTTPRFIALFAGTVGGLAAAYALRVPFYIGFFLGLLLLVAFAAQHGFPVRRQLRFMASGAGQTLEVVWILLLVGLLIPSWTASGTIPYMIDAGVRAIPPDLFLTGCFLFAAFVSMLLGTSTGTLSAVGIPLIGVGTALHVPEPFAAGALISGAFVGDRTSPFSSAHRLVGASTGTDAKTLWRAMLPTTALGVATAATVFLLLDAQGHWAVPDAGPAGGLYGVRFRYHPMLAVPPVLLVGSILFRAGTKVAFLLSIAASVAIGTFLQQVKPGEWVTLLAYGFRDAAYPALEGKGLFSMVDLVVLIAMAGAFNGILEHTGLADRFWAKVVGGTRSLVAATARTAAFGAALCLISCTQTLPIMMTGRNLLAAWTNRFPAAHLSRVVADTSLLFAALIPWNMLAVLCSAIIGIGVERYAPFAIFVWAVPLWTLLWSLGRDLGRKPDRTPSIR